MRALPPPMAKSSSSSCLLVPPLFLGPLSDGAREAAL